MFVPLPWFIALPCNLIKIIWYLTVGRKKLTDRDRDVLKWLSEPNDPMRPQDYKIRRVAELNEVIKTGRSVYIKYIDRHKELSFRRIIPERLFRRGNKIYVHCHCLKGKEMRVFRVDRIKHLGD